MDEVLNSIYISSFGGKCPTLSALIDILTPRKAFGPAGDIRSSKNVQIEMN
jgi:hypothetical protein